MAPGFSFTIAKAHGKYMVLSDVDIRKALASGKIAVNPAMPEEHIGSCSVDFRLGNEFSIFEHSKHAFIDLRDKVDISKLMRTIVVPDGEAFILQPREFALAITVEHLELAPDILGRLEGRSSLGRIGIIVHGTAGLFDPGWSGRATLELSNLGIMPVALYPGMRICSMTFEELSTPSSMPYRSKPGNKYAGQQSPLASKLAGELK